MTPYQNAAWLQIGIDVWTLGWQATRVMGLRTAKIAEGGPSAGMEAWLMLSEKWQTAVEVQSDLLLRGPNADPVATTRRTLARYRKKVAANDRRLR